MLSAVGAAVGEATGADSLNSVDGGTSLHLHGRAKVLTEGLPTAKRE